jgi:hypothetical protein
MLVLLVDSLVLRKISGIADQPGGDALHTYIALQTGMDTSEMVFYSSSVVRPLQATQEA